MHRGKPKDGRVLRALSLVVRLVLVPVHQVLVWMHRVVGWFEQPRYRIQGSCCNNGLCCRQLLLVESPFLTWPGLTQLTHFWMERIYPFQITKNAILDPESGEYFRILTCANLVEKKCREHWLRPRICRAWPNDSWGAPAILFTGCGFYVVDRLGDDQRDVSRRRDSRWDEGVAGLVCRFKSATGDPVKREKK